LQPALYMEMPGERGVRCQTYDVGSDLAASDGVVDDHDGRQKRSGVKFWTAKGVSDSNWPWIRARGGGIAVVYTVPEGCRFLLLFDFEHPNAKKSPVTMGVYISSVF
jgi:hypothetical protein